jgi:SAM-dependent methyltransferase
MGRFASSVDFYARYREPYLPEFFKKVAEQIGLGGDEPLLDVGCGPALLAIGFAPFVGCCTGLDPEPGMITAAKTAAAEAGVALSLIYGRIEEFPATQTYDVITIGRALHWMERSATLAVLERILAPDSGRILICRASSIETPETAWVKPYREVRRAWASGPDEKHYRIDGKEWFADSCFSALGETSVNERRQITISDLIGRALSRSNTSPEILGEGQTRFEAEIAAALEPFIQDGVLVEHIVTRASIFGRLPRVG